LSLIGKRSIFELNIKYKLNYNNKLAMNVYENAWKNIVMPIQIQSKKHLLGPTERTINGTKIVRVDL
jgi:hypothetical protein